jgi:hypothetical protein
VYDFNVEFADEQICLCDPDLLEEPDRTHTSMRFRGDMMCGTRVVIVNSLHFRGYRGTIQYAHKALEFYGVRLEATGRIIQVSEHLLVELS